MPPPLLSSGNGSKALYGYQMVGRLSTGGSFCRPVLIGESLVGPPAQSKAGPAVCVAKFQSRYG